MFKINDNTEIPYILVIDDKGYARDAKYLKPKKDLPLQGEEVESFYGDKFLFFNIGYQLKNANEQIYIIEDNNFIAHNSSYIEEQTEKALLKYLQLIENVESVELNYKRNGDPSKLEEIKQQMERVLGLNIPEKVEEEFTLLKYQKLHNELVKYSTVGDLAHSQFVHYLLIGVNTLLASEEIIPSSLYNNGFATSRNEEDDRELVLDPRSGRRTLETLDIIANKIVVQKPKMR